MKHMLSQIFSLAYRRFDPGLRATLDKWKLLCCYNLCFGWGPTNKTLYQLIPQGPQICSYNTHLFPPPLLIPFAFYMTACIWKGGQHWSRCSYKPCEAHKQKEAQCATPTQLPSMLNESRFLHLSPWHRCMRIFVRLEAGHFPAELDPIFAGFLTNSSWQIGYYISSRQMQELFWGSRQKMFLCHSGLSASWRQHKGFRKPSTACFICYKNAAR